MTTPTDLIILVSAVLLIFTAFIYLVRGIRSRQGATGNLYGVARQEARRDMLVAVAKAIILLILGVALIGIFVVIPRTETNGSNSTTPSPNATTLPNSPTAEMETLPSTPDPTEHSQPPSSPTNVLSPPTRTTEPTVTPSLTITPDIPTAVVNSPNGLWLREVPGGTQELELIPHETALILLAGLEIVDDLEWQEVLTPSGNEGWVAADFVIYQ